MVNTISSDAELAILSIIVAHAFGLFGALAAVSMMKYYTEQVKKPSWVLSSWIHGLIWMIIYTLLGLSYWLVRRGEFMSDILASTIVYYILLIFIALWPWIFFMWKQYTFAAIWIFIVFGLEIAVVILFARSEGWVPAVLNILLLIWTFFILVINSWIAYYNDRWFTKKGTTVTSSSQMPGNSYTDIQNPYKIRNHDGVCINVYR